jgi:hypothetical protein
MHSLDLKFVIHHGNFIKQKMSGREELKRFGPHADALYSDPCVQATGIDPIAQGLVEQFESIDVIGEVKCWVRDLEKGWTKENESRRAWLSAPTLSR